MRSNTGQANAVVIRTLLGEKSKVHHLPMMHFKIVIGREYSTSFSTWKRADDIPMTKFDLSCGLTGKPVRTALQPRQNKALHPTAYSLRSFARYASGGG